MIDTLAACSIGLGDIIAKLGRPPYTAVRHTQTKQRVRADREARERGRTRGRRRQDAARSARVGRGDGDAHTTRALGEVEPVLLGR